MEVIEGGGIGKFWNKGYECGVESLIHLSISLIVLYKSNEVLSESIKKIQIEFHISSKGSS